MPPGSTHDSTVTSVADLRFTERMPGVPAGVTRDTASRSPTAFASRMSTVPATSVPATPAASRSAPYPRPVDAMVICVSLSRAALRSFGLPAGVVTVA